MKSVEAVILILALVFLGSLFYFCCWMYCNHRCCKGYSNDKSRRKKYKGDSKGGPLYIRAEKDPDEERGTYTNNNTTNTYKPAGNDYLDSKMTTRNFSVPELKYPTAPTESRLLTTSIPENKIAAPSLLTTASTERSYNPIGGGDRRYSSNSYFESSTNRIPSTNATTTTTYMERKSPFQQDKSYASPSWMSEKRSVSPFRTASPPYEPSRLNSYSGEFSRFRAGGLTGGISNSSTTTTTTTVNKKEGGDDTVTLTVKTDDAGKIQSLLEEAVKAGELNSAQTVIEKKTVDVRNLAEKYENVLNVTKTSTLEESTTEAGQILSKILETDKSQSGDDSGDDANNLVATIPRTSSLLTRTVMQIQKPSTIVREVVSETRTITKDNTKEDEDSD